MSDTSVSPADRYRELARAFTRAVEEVPADQGKSGEAADLALRQLADAGGLHR